MVNPLDETAEGDDQYQYGKSLIDGFVQNHIEIIQKMALNIFFVCTRKISYL